MHPKDDIGREFGYHSLRRISSAGWYRASRFSETGRSWVQVPHAPFFVQIFSTTFVSELKKMHVSTNFKDYEVFITCLSKITVSVDFVYLFVIFVNLDLKFVQIDGRPVQSYSSQLKANTNSFVKIKQMITIFLSR